jgi:hypothetical protein
MIMAFAERALEDLPTAMGCEPQGRAEYLLGPEWNIVQMCLLSIACIITARDMGH